MAADTEQVLTGFHAIEERIRNAAGHADAAMRIAYSVPAGPRVKKILALAGQTEIPCNACVTDVLDNAVKALPVSLRDHRGIVLFIRNTGEQRTSVVEFDHWLAALDSDSSRRLTVLVLDSVTDPHNVGAVLRCCDQFGVSLVLVPERRSVSSIAENDVIARSSAGASTWVPVSVVKNLVRSVQQLKDAGFWIYGADAGGESVQTVRFPLKTVLVMGSEGSGMARLLSGQCDTIVSIPTCGKVDSLNVSVAAGVLLYEIYRQSLQTV